MPPPRYRLTKLAAADYAAIVRFTLKRWGQEQPTAYRRLLDDGIVEILRILHDRMEVSSKLP